MGNYSYYHPGGCQGFPLDKGRQYLSHVSSFAESHCEVVSLKPYTFYPDDKPVHVQITVNYINTSLPAKVHDATVTWTEKVSTDNFTACITKTGRDDKQTNDITSVDWIAYQGAPNGGVTGKERFTQWWTGTKCRTLSLPSGKFTGSPTVLVTLEHQRDGLKHDAASVWVEDISSSSFQVCIRELQNFDGIHEEIDVDITSHTFRVCIKELYSDRYDPVTLQYTVVSDICGEGWTYFNGFCYMTNSSCAPWQAAQSSCLNVNANLTSISSQEENTYIQHRHGGDTGWIGFQDIHSEGNFTWIDGNTVTVQTTCSYSTINSYSGKFTSPGYPGNYGDGQTCTWTLTSSTRVSLSFQSFVTESCCDHVRVYDGDSSSFPSLGVFSGSSLPPTITSSSNQLYITFTTDSSGTTSGFSAKYQGVQHGTHRTGRSSVDGYYCDTITFPSAFTGVGSVKVFTSVGFGMSSTRVHDVVFTWVESVTTSSFKVCLVESGTGSNGNATINWIAYQGTESGVADGSARFRDWTTGTQCNHVPLQIVDFNEPYYSPPSIVLAPSHVYDSSNVNSVPPEHNSIAVWVE
ncbi:hypothetical protein QZH41_018434, partial [Actinostola sp. cb2023]